jgi:starch phosphorylase
VVPTYYARGEMGYSVDWIRMAKHSIGSLLPRFSSTRMVNEYLTKFYLPAARQGRRFDEDGHSAARKLAEWKAHVRANWPAVAVRRLDTPRRNIAYGEAIRFEVGVALGGLKPEDVAVELLFSREAGDGQALPAHYRFEAEGVKTEQGEHRFALELTPQLCGKLEYRIRVYPHSELLTRPFELGMMRWL